MIRDRNAMLQAKMIREAVIRKWGPQAWALFSLEEQIRLVALEFMSFLSSQAHDDNDALNHYRDTAQELLTF